MGGHQATLHTRASPGHKDDQAALLPAAAQLGWLLLLMLLATSKVSSLPTPLTHCPPRNLPQDTDALQYTSSYTISL